LRGLRSNNNFTQCIISDTICLDFGIQR
jgi:hypothetical protein